MTLDEMFLIYRACANELNLQMKIAAASQGGEVDFNDDWYEPEDEDYIGEHNFSSLPIGIGYQEI